MCLCLQHASKSNVPVIPLIPGDTLSVTHTSQVYQRDFGKFDSNDLGEQQGLNHSPTWFNYVSPCYGFTLL